MKSCGEEDIEKVYENFPLNAMRIISLTFIHWKQVFIGVFHKFIRFYSLYHQLIFDSYIYVYVWIFLNI